MDGMDEFLARAASRFERGLGELADDITARIRQEVSELSNLDAPEIWEVHRGVTIGSRRAQVRHLRAGRALPLTCPEPDLEAVRLAAHGGTSLAALLHGYRIGHDVSLDAWLDAIEALDDPDGTKEAAVRALVRFTLGYHDRLTANLEAAYLAEQERVRGSAEIRRLRGIRDLVEGRASEAKALDYDVTLEHVAVISRGSDAATVTRAAASQLDCRIASAPAPDGLLLVWLGSSSSLGPSYRTVFKNVSATADASLAVGRPWPGLEGLRRTHREAGAAHLVANKRGGTLTFYEDFTPEAWALQNPTLARELVASELAGINGDDRAFRTVRETLLEYFRREQNQTATAAALGINTVTVARRLARIEELIGHPVNRRRLELELALRLRPFVLDESVR